MKSLGLRDGDLGNYTPVPTLEAGVEGRPKMIPSDPAAHSVTHFDGQEWW